MSQENVEIVRRGFEAYERGDVPAMLADLSPDLAIHRTPPQPDAGIWHGPDGMLEALAGWTAEFEEFEMRAESFVDANDDQVVVRAHQRAVGRASGVPTEADFWLVCTLSGGRITRMDIYAWEEQALRAAGLSPT